MKNRLDLIAEDLANTPKKIFLLDGLGALITAFMLSTILARFNAYFGMPGHVLYILVLAACVLMLYSSACYLLLNHNHRPFLLLITFANVLYCGFTLGLVNYFYKRLTALGILYFLLESLVILGLVLIEKKVYDKL